jgi:ribA/ribD-fused uncharacterized protein
MRKTNKYLFFWEGGSIFSQWNSKKEYNKDYQFIDEKNIKYSSCEQYMMYQKAILFKDEKIAKEIMSIKDVKKIKALGRQVKNLNINIWDQHKFNIIVKANYLKFSQNIFFKEELLSYKDLIFVEASPYDKIYGVGLHYSDDKSSSLKNIFCENFK